MFDGNDREDSRVLLPLREAVVHHSEYPVCRPVRDRPARRGHDFAEAARPLPHRVRSLNFGLLLEELTAKPFSTEQLSVRVQQAGQRRTVGYFIEHKFEQPTVLEELKKYGFVEGNYKQIIVTWGAARKHGLRQSSTGIQVWDFRDLLCEIAEAYRDHKTYFTDDTARTIQLFAMASDGRKSRKA